jgi:hypothetical protein
MCGVLISLFPGISLGADVEHEVILDGTSNYITVPPGTWHLTVWGVSYGNMSSSVGCTV